MFGRRRNPDDFSNEVRAHLEHEEAELRAAGMSTDEARAEARRRFGSPTRAIEEVREAHPMRVLETLWQDVKYGVRLMRRSPAFSITAALVLSLGIGVNTALFSIVNALFFKPLPVEAPEELFYLYTKNEAGQVMASFDQTMFEYFASRAPDLADYTGHWGVRMPFSVDGETEVVSGEWVRGNYFDLLGVRAQLGRILGPSEDDPANPVIGIVISDRLWNRRFKRDPDVIGRQVRIRYFTATIVGVAEPGFDGLSDPWNPSAFWASGLQMYGAEYGRPAIGYIGGPIGRLRPGVSFAEVQAFFAATLPQWKQERLDFYRTRTASQFEDTRRRMMALQVPIYRAVDTRMPFDPESRLIPPAMLAGMIAVVGLVLLIATANIAGLLLARGVTRTGEVAVRRALGAGGTRVTRQLLTESVLLAFAGGALGLAIATTLVGIFRAYTPSRFAVDVPVDVRVLLFAVAVCVGAGILVGLAPALQAARVNVLEALGSGIVGARVVRARLRHWIVVPQVALSLVLLLIAAVHVRALLKIERGDRGYRPDNAVVLNIGRWERQRPYPAPRETQEAQANTARVFSRAVLERVGNVPRVGAYALADRLPMTAGNTDLKSVLTQDAYNAGLAPEASATMNIVSDGYFDAMGMRVIRGRSFDERDAPYEMFQPHVAVVSESVARTLWPAGDPIGQSFTFVAENPGERINWLTVIGIVNDVEPVLDDAVERPRVYVSVVQQWRPSPYYLIVRGAGDQSALIRDVKAAVIGADAFAEVSRVQTVDQIVGEILYPRRIAAGVLTTGGLIGLLLACIGLYGVMSYSLAQRMREIGIRTTLGAERGDILALVLREGAHVVGLGAAAGTLLALLALRLTAGLLPDVPVVDLASLVGVPAVLAVVVGTACYVPARRAASIDPARVLRGE